MDRKSYGDLSRAGKYEYLNKLRRKRIANEVLAGGQSQLPPAKTPCLDDGSRDTELERRGEKGFEDRNDRANTSKNEENLAVEQQNDDSHNAERDLIGESDGEQQNDEDQNPESNVKETEIEALEEDIEEEEIQASEEDVDQEEVDPLEGDIEEEEIDPLEEDVDEEEIEALEDDENNADDVRQPQRPDLHDDNNRPLYVGASITVAESMMLILTLLLKHNITGSCLSDIITVINIHCLSEGLRKNSLYKFRTYFSMPENQFQKHYYCSMCQTSLESVNSMCSNCNARKGTSYFVEMPFLKQLADIFNREGFYELLQHRFHRGRVTSDTICDIYDGSLYKKYEATGFLSNPNNISVMFYTDGVPVFKSSKVSMWPIFLTINELPYKYRIKRENTTLAGLWFGNKKPAANHFVYKLRSEFAKLFQGKEYLLPGGRVIYDRGILLAGTCDLPAKADFLNMTAHNGQFGCPNCKSPGTVFTHPTGGTSRVYSYENDPQMRTTAETKNNADQALLQGVPINGVKGPCSLSRLMSDFVEGFAIDYMHGIFCGITKRLLSLWFDTCYSGSEFSLSAVSGVVNEKLLKIKPPKWVHRLPRSVSDFSHWKASEIRMWFFYYSLPVLRGIMRWEYFENYFSLVNAIAILNSERITRQQLDAAKKMLHKFVQDFQTFYGLQFCTINIHQLLHLPACVERLGPLWVYSCFPFEDLNGKLLSLVHGTSHIDSQIASAHTYLLQMKAELDKLPEGPIRDFAIAVKRQVKICQQVFDACYSVGTYKKYSTIPEFIAQEMRNLHIPIGNVQSYMRLLKDQKLIVGELYPRILRTSSSHVLYNGANDSKMIGCVQNFIKITYCDCEKECFCKGEHYAVIAHLVKTIPFQATTDDEIPSKLSYLHECHRTDNMSLIRVAALESVGVFISIDRHSFIGTPINSMELE